MSPDLSRRCGRAFHHPPAQLLSVDERVAFEARNESAQTFDDLSREDRELILASEKEV